MSLYTRQYTEDVGWENTPSVATPINSTNLNKMDDAIGAIDAAVKSAFDSLESKQRTRFRYAKNTASGAKLNLQCGTIVDAYNSIDDLHDGDVLVVYIQNDISLSQGNTWTVQAYKQTGEQSEVSISKQLRDSSGGYITSDFSAGSMLFMLFDATNNYWKLQCIIGGSAGAFYNTKISSASSGTMHSSLEVPSAFKDGDTILVQMNTPCASSYLRLYFEYTIFDGSSYSANVVTLYDATNGADGTSYFSEDLKNGDILLLKQAGDKLTCAAYIPTAKTNCHNTKAEVTSIGEISSGWTLSDYLESGDIIVVQMQTPGSPSSVTPMSEDKKWDFVYSVGANEFNAAVYDKTNEASGASYFDKELSKGDILLLEIVDNTRMDCIAYLPCSDVVVDHYNAIIDSASSGEITSTLVLDKYLRYGDIIVVQMNDSGSPSGATPRWEFLYATDIDEYTGYSAYVYDKRNGADGTSYFAEDLSVGDILIFEVRTNSKVDCVSYIPASGGGTTVVANPSGEATDELEKIQIGSTIYDIPGTGGVGGQYTCDLLFENNPLPTPTSGTENVTRSYTLSHSIDGYDAVYVTSYVYHQSPNGEGDILSSFILKENYYLVGFDGNGEMDNASTNSYRRSIFYTFTDDTHLTTVAVRSESGIEPILYKVYGLKFNATIFSPKIYSEEEREIGCYTDGKPLYQKSIPFNNTSASYLEIDVAGLSIDRLTNTELSYLFSSGNDNYKGSGIYYYTSSDLIRAYVDSNTNKLALVRGNDYPITSDGMVTIQYTKTTDQPGSAHWLPGGTIAVNYSTEEQYVGLYNGKTLYQKTFTGTLTNTSAADVETATIVNIGASVDKFVNAYGEIIDDTNVTQVFPCSRVLNNVRSHIRLALNDNAEQSNPNTAAIQNGWYTSGTNTYFLTIQYTKITDTAGSPNATILATQAELEAIADRITGTGRFVVSGETATFVPIGS